MASSKEASSGSPLTASGTTYETESPEMPGAHGRHFRGTRTTPALRTPPFP